eukprot:TRINITY_DN14789_c0_g1_i1.p1 TRINITY_DN14789_c0_g1~~TRINITY_DN14789_c0_g1_i1.p1  ORF type:complete len:140 (+),score=4.70 TRINITY_DN14789_c0_g1_i1:29-448(+)
MILNENQKIGVLLTAFGVFFTTLGVFLFFDRVLLALGNILFLCGITFILGMRRIYNFFFRHRKMKHGSIPFFVGIALVIIGWPFFGTIIELYGFVNLFGDFIPYVLSFLQNVPVVNSILRLPVIKQLVDKIIADGRLPV